MEKQKRVYDGGMRSNEPTPNPIDIRIASEKEQQAFVIGHKFMKVIIERMISPGTLEELKGELRDLINRADDFNTIDNGLEDAMYFYRVLNNPELQEWLDLDKKA